MEKPFFLLFSFKEKKGWNELKNPEVSGINLLSSSLMLQQNKLECWTLPSLMFAGKD
jgi:hypothetical protein